MGDACNTIEEGIRLHIPGRRFKPRSGYFAGRVLLRTALNATSTTAVSLKGGDTCVSQTVRAQQYFTSSSQQQVVAVAGMRILVSGAASLTDAARARMNSDLYLKWQGATGTGSVPEFLQGPSWWGGEADTAFAVADTNAATSVSRSTRGPGPYQRTPRGIWVVDWLADTFEIGTLAAITGASALEVLIEMLCVVSSGSVANVCEDDFKPTRQAFENARQAEQGALLQWLADESAPFIGQWSGPPVGRVIGNNEPTNRR